MKKKLPKLETDEEAEEFVANADLTEYDPSGFRSILFEFQPSSPAALAVLSPSTSGATERPLLQWSGRAHAASVAVRAPARVATPLRPCGDPRL